MREEAVPRNDERRHYVMCNAPHHKDDTEEARCCIQRPRHSPDTHKKKSVTSVPVCTVTLVFTYSSNTVNALDFS
jgi:hypothetical protein